MPRITLNGPVVVLLVCFMVCATVLALAGKLPMDVLTHAGVFIAGLIIPSEPLATKTVYVGDRRGGGGASGGPPPPTSPPPKLPPIVSGLLVLVLLAGASLLGACVHPWSPNEAQLVAQDTAEQLACVNDAGTREEAERCQCAVRARYPGPQCDASADGGAP